MGLGDIYGSDQAQAIATGAERRTSDAFGSLPGYEMQSLQNQSQRQSNVDQAYNSPAREATHHEQAIGEYVQKMMDGPPHFVDRLKKEMSGQGGLQQPAPQGAQQYQGPGAQGGWPQQDPTNGVPQVAPPSLAAPASQVRAAPNYAMNMPRPDSDQTNYLSGQSQSPYGGDESGMQRPTPMPQSDMNPRRTMDSMAPARGPQSAVPKSYPMTRGDVNEYMRMSPLIATESRERIAANKPQGTDQMELEKLRQKGRLELEGTKQTGRIDVDAIRGARQKLMKAAELALGYKQLDETTSRHIDQFNVDLAKLENMAKFQDRLLDMKQGSGRDEMLNNMRQTVTSLMASKSQLTASGFGGTPLGQEFLKDADAALAGPLTILQDYENGKRSPPTQQPGSITKRTQTEGGTNRPPPPTLSPRKIGGGQPTQPQQAAPTGTFRFRFKVDTAYGKAGSTGSADAADYDPKVMEIIR